MPHIIRITPAIKDPIAITIQSIIPTTIHNPHTKNPTHGIRARQRANPRRHPKPKITIGIVSKGTIIMMRQIKMRVRIRNITLTVMNMRMAKRSIMKQIKKRKSRTRPASNPTIAFIIDMIIPIIKIAIPAIIRAMPMIKGMKSSSPIAIGTIPIMTNKTPITGKHPPAIIAVIAPKNRSTTANMATSSPIIVNIRPIAMETAVRTIVQNIAITKYAKAHVIPKQNTT